jgi:hypothetical protein
MFVTQGLSFLALAFRFARERAKKDRCVSMRLELSAIALVSLSPVSLSGQEQQGVNPGSAGFTISAERLDQVRPLRPDRQQLLTYQVSDSLLDNFDRRSLEFRLVREHLANADAEDINETFGRTTKRRVERSVTRTIVRAVERTEFITRIREEPWKERIFDVVKDAFTEETPTIGTPLTDEDPNVDYDVEKPVVEKPAWKDRVSFFFRPFSLHPNVGVGLKVDGIRAQIKAYHDEVKFSAFKAITDTWSLYSSARMKEFDPEEAQVSVGFQHTIRCVPGASPGILQYGVSIRNRPLFDRDTGRTFREFRPYAFMAFVFDY